MHSVDFIMFDVEHENAQSVEGEWCRYHRLGTLRHGVYDSFLGAGARRSLPRGNKHTMHLATLDSKVERPFTGYYSLY